MFQYNYHHPKCSIDFLGIYIRTSYLGFLLMLLCKTEKKTVQRPMQEIRTPLLRLEIITTTIHMLYLILINNAIFTYSSNMIVGHLGTTFRKKISTCNMTNLYKSDLPDLTNNNTSACRYSSYKR